MITILAKRIPYKKLFAYKIFYGLRDVFTADKQLSKVVSNRSRSMEIKSFLIKTSVVFLAIYFVVVIPLASSIKDATKGIDISLNKTSTKLILVSLISNPETLFLLANEELKSANRVKAQMFIDTAIGIIESHNSSPAYKIKFYKLRDKILELPDKK